jgi:hypothetical protein
MTILLARANAFMNRMPRVAQEWERRYAERSRVSITTLRKFGRVVAPCDCGEAECEGWCSLPLNLAIERLRKEQVRKVTE